MTSDGDSDRKQAVTVTARLQGRDGGGGGGGGGRAGEWRKRHAEMLESCETRCSAERAKAICWFWKGLQLRAQENRGA